MDRWLAWLQLRQQPPIPFPELSVFTCALSRIAGLTYRLKIGLIVATASGDRLDVVNPRILCLSSAPAAHTQPALSSDDVPPQLRGKYDTFRGPRPEHFRAALYLFCGAEVSFIENYELPPRAVALKQRLYELRSVESRRLLLTGDAVVVDSLRRSGVADEGVNVVSALAAFGQDVINAAFTRPLSECLWMHAEYAACLSGRNVSHGHDIQ